MRHAAWLAATPEKSKTPRAARLEADAKAAGIDDPLLELPDPSPAAHVVQILFDIGPVKAGAMSVVPLEETDILAWQFNRETKLTSWECRQIKQLSREYAAMSQDATKPECPPPTADVEPTEQQRKSVASAFKELAVRRKRKR